MSAPETRAPGGNRADAVDKGSNRNFATPPARAPKAAKAQRDLTPGQRARLVGHPKQLDLPLAEGEAP